MFIDEWFGDNFYIRSGPPRRRGRMPISTNGERFARNDEFADAGLTRLLISSLPHTVNALPITASISFASAF